MATFDELSGGQRAIVELTVRGGHSYDEVSRMLGMAPSAVRELAREGLSQLAPATAGRVEPEWRGQLADYLLGQQSPREAEETRGHLEHSEAARSWVLSLLDSLDPIYEDGVRPPVPEPQPAATEPARRASDAPAAVRRRRVAVAVVVAGVLAVALAWFLLPGAGVQPGGALREAPQGAQAGRPEAPGAQPPGNPQAQPTFLAAGDLLPVAGERGRGEFAVQLAKRSRQLVLLADVRVEAIERDEAYVLWLYNSREDALAVGVVEEIGQGVHQGLGILPADFAKYRFVDLSRESAEIIESSKQRAPRHSGNSVLRGSLRSAGSGAGARPGAREPPGGRAP